MKWMLHAFIAIAVFILVVACYGTDVVKPPEGPNTAYPCGVRGVVCPNSRCCPEDHICGFDGFGSRCAPNYCCYDGDHWPAMGSPDASRATSRAIVKQEPFQSE